MLHINYQEIIEITKAEHSYLRIYFLTIHVQLSLFLLQSSAWFQILQWTETNVLVSTTTTFGQKETLTAMKQCY